MRETSPCDNSDDSGLGIENSPEYYSYPHPSIFRFATAQVSLYSEGVFNLRYELTNNYAFVAQFGVIKKSTLMATIKVLMFTRREKLVCTS